MRRLMLEQIENSQAELHESERRRLKLANDRIAGQLEKSLDALELAWDLVLENCRCGPAREAAIQVLVAHQRLIRKPRSTRYVKPELPPEPEAPPM